VAEWSPDQPKPLLGLSKQKDGTHLAMSAQDNTIRIWNTKPALAVDAEHFSDTESLVAFIREHLPFRDGKN
jgi:WD40 repeat protein